MSEVKERDDYTGTETTGHEWDGIQELNTPLPRWWVLTLWATILGSIVYFIYMPSFPIPGEGGLTYWKGIGNYSQRNIVASQLEKQQAEWAVVRERISNSSLDDILNDAQLLDFAVASGKATFGDNCAGCHGSGAQGFVGYPDLNDDDWIWGGTLEDIELSIRHGIRWDADDNTRMNDMPAFVRDEMLTSQEATDVVNYVLSLSGGTSDAASAARGSTVFEEQCTSCHGPGGEGNADMGSPNLTDAKWLYGGDREAIMASVSDGRNGVMPAWEGRLSDAQIKELALYVHTLGGGQ